MPDDEPKCSGGSRRRRQKTARAPVVRSVVGSRWDVRIRPSPRSSAPARPEPRFQSYSANGPFARPTRERSGLERPDLSPVASHPSRAPGRSGNSGSELSRFAGSCAVGSVRWYVPSMLELILRVISLSNLCLGSTAVAAAYVDDRCAPAKPDNGLDGTSFYGLVFLLGQFNLDGNRLSKLEG